MVSVSDLPDVTQAAAEFHVPRLLRLCQDQARLGAPEEYVYVKESVVADLGDLVGSHRLSDVVFVVEGKRVFGHRFVMSVRSQYFRSALTMGMKESGQTEIIIAEVDYEPFMTVLGFIYTGRSAVVTEDIVVDVLEAANYFSEHRLKCVCEEVLKSGLDVENVSYLLAVAVRFEADQLHRVCSETIFQNFDAVAKTKTFQDMDRELLVNLLSEACRHIRRSYVSVPLP